MRIARLPLTALALALLAAACSGSDGDPTPTPNTEAQPTSTATATATPAVAADDPVEWDPDVAAQLVALEAANDGQWTVDTALQAVALVRPHLIAGVTADAPIGLTRLAVFLMDNFDDVPAAEWDDLLASTAGAARPANQLISFQPGPVREVLQDFAATANADFTARSGHSLDIPIYVAITDLAKPGDVYAATTATGTDLAAFKWLFADDDPNPFWQSMADDVSVLLDSNAEVCVIIIGQTMLGWDATRQLAGLMHEVVHCHQNVAHPLGRFGFHASPVLWMDEGYAGWAGEAYVGGSTHGPRFWSAYLRGGIGSQTDGFQLFAGAHRSLGFYSMLQAAGIDPWAEFYFYFHDLRINTHTNGFRYQSMIAGANQEVVAGWTASASRNDALGAPWNSDRGPGIQFTTSRRSPSLSRLTSDDSVTAAVAEQRYVAYDVITPVDEPSLITISAKGLATLRWEHDDWNEQLVVTDTLDVAWCVGEDCTCDDGTSPAPGALLAPISAGQQPTLHAALLGAPGTGAQLDVSVASLEDECEEEEEPPAVGPLDSCLFGIWNPDPNQFRDLVLRFYSTIPQISGLTLEGTIDLTFNDDGTFFHTYDGVQGTGIVNGVTYTATWSGGTFGTWEASAGVMALTFTGTDVRVTLAPIPIPAGAPGIPTATVEASYDCGSTTLAVDPPPTLGNLWPLPEDWTKVADVAPLN